MADKQVSYEVITNDLEQSLNNQQALEITLNEQTNQIEKLTIELDEKNVEHLTLKKELDEKCASQWKSELEGYREQVRQHAKTICFMEERLMKLTNQARDYKLEVGKLKKANAGLFGFSLDLF